MDGRPAGAVAGGLTRLPFTLAAQTEVTERDLELVSGNRTVIVGSPGAGGRIASLPFEVYVSRVLAGEGEPKAADAASQALAIAIRHAHGNRLEAAGVVGARSRRRPQRGPLVRVRRLR